MKRAALSNADITAVIASSGGGKSHWIKGRGLAALPRPVIVWDWMGEYDQGKAYATLGALVAGLRGGADVVVFRPNKKNRDAWMAQFNGLCAVVLALGDCSFIAEELSHVTKSNWAPAGWMEIITGGRHSRLHVIGTTQRPVLCDKTFLGGATVARVGYLRGASDKKVMADILDIPMSTLRALKKRDWISADDSGNVKYEIISKPAIPEPGTRSPRAS